MNAKIVIVGAGPVGLLTAIELKLGGAHPLVLDRLDAPSRALKAFSVGPLGIEALRRRGMTAAVAAADAQSFAAMKQLKDLRTSKFSGHFAGLSLIRKDAQVDPERRPLAVDQQSLEAMLADRCRSLDIEVRRGCEVTAFTQDQSGVEVEWNSPTGKTCQRCAYLVGCDGGHSLVRKMGSFEFPGTPPSLTLYQVIAEIDYPDRLLPIGWHRTSHGVFAYGPFPGRLFLLDFSGPPADRHAPVTREEVESVLRRVSGQDVRVPSLEIGNRWTDNTRLVDTYRKERVLLAGDAAHVHSPFGGQGLSLGLLDAANLGWKLAAVVSGRLPDRLLETYTSERRPVAQAVLANTLAQVAIMRPDPQAGAMRELMAGLLEIDEVNRRIGEMMMGLSVRYDLGSDCAEVGRLLADRALQPDLNLYDLMQDGSGVFLDATADGHATLLIASQKVRCVRSADGVSMLIRPDACVAWAGQNVDGLESALRSWFRE